MNNDDFEDVEDIEDDVFETEIEEVPKINNNALFRGILAVFVIIIFGIIGAVAWYYYKSSVPAPALGSETTNGSNATTGSNATAAAEDDNEVFEPSSLTVELYTECNFSGTIYDLGVGNHYASANHFPDNIVQGMKVPIGLKATLYEFDRKNGRSKVLLPGDYPCLTDFKSITSSIKIEVFEHPVLMGPIELPYNQKIYIYGTKFVKILTGETTISSPTDFDENNIDNIDIPYGYKLIITFTDSTTVETTKPFENGVYPPAGYGPVVPKKPVSRIQVVKYIPPVDPNLKVKFYTEEDQKGRMIEAGCGVLKNIALLLPTLKSIWIPEKIQVIFFDNGTKISNNLISCEPHPIMSHDRTYYFEYCDSIMKMNFGPLAGRQGLKVLILPLETTESVRLYTTLQVY